MPEQKNKPERTQTADVSKPGESAQVRFEGEPQKAEEAGSGLSRFLKASVGKGRVREEIITSFLRQLVMLLEAGVTLLRGMNTLASRTSNKTFRDVLKSVADRIEAGNTLWQSLSYHPRFFNHLFVSTIRAGESSGTLTEIITHLAEYREKRDLLRRQVRSALAYPFVIVMASLAVLILYFVFVVPQFESMFKSFEIDLPLITRAALAFTHALVGFWWLWILIIVGLVFLVYSYAQTSGGRLRIDYWKMHMPIFGQVITKRVVADFANTFATLLNAGISILETLDLAKEAVGNSAFAQDLQQVRESIERGEGLEKPLRRSKVVPPLVTDMLATGEESGALEKVSRQMAAIFEREVETAVLTLRSLIEPIMILGLGLVVLFLTLSFFWPYVSLLTQITGIE
ncbi:MAG: type II secretion system F family protein [Candidatus Abyssobacteria bacterium SURF_17]|jgi:type IV pilus assembly protein PilC|uniref:General secretion pathway protein F n=1 Tax=Candidatus Abyssobacteria bacterium SURF_17 TaxID=2093361 RepID=A0A419F9U9_9BACT|nr:MAG: type II secretion system F family protein [Candidatus Abyssubacteria bacterium SURF_17]